MNEKNDEKKLEEVLGLPPTIKKKIDAATDEKPKRTYTKRAKKQDDSEFIRMALTAIFSPRPEQKDKEPKWEMSKQEIEVGVMSLTPFFDSKKDAKKWLEGKIPGFIALAWIVPVMLERWVFIKPKLNFFQKIRLWIESKRGKK